MVRPGYKQTEIGLIPEDWEVLPWGECLSGFTSGATPYRGKPEYYTGTIKWVTSGELNYNTIYDTNEHITNEAKVQTNLSIHPIGTFLIAITGLEAAGTRGSCALLGAEATTNQSCMAIYSSDVLATRYLYYFYVKNGDKLAFQYCQGTKQQSYTAAIVKKLPIIIPPLDEQQRIADALSDIDELILSLEKLIAKKKAIKQGAMQELLTGKRRLPGYNGKWKMATWKAVLDGFISGATPYRGNSDYYKGEIKWISSGELNYKHITDSFEHISKKAMEDTSLKMHPSGTFLMAITGLEAAGTRGSCAILDVPATTNQSCMAIYSTEKMSTLFLYYYYLKNGNELAFQYCQGTKQQSFTAAIVKELPVWYPEDIHEQNAIAAILADADCEIDALEQKTAKARQMKQGMMQQLLTGKIRLI